MATLNMCNMEDIKSIDMKVKSWVRPQNAYGANSNVT